MKIMVMYMNPLQKRFEFHTLFPFTIVYQDTKSPQSELPDHFHDSYEIVYVYQGKGVFFIDNTFHDMQQGDVFVIPGNTIHRAIPDKKNPVTSTALFFSPAMIQSASFGDSFTYLHLFDKKKKNKNHKIPLPPEKQQTMKRCLETMNQEMQRSEPGFKHAVALYLHMALLELNRAFFELNQEPIPSMKTGPKWIKESLDYIELNLEECHTLTDIAVKARVSPEHFSRTFKATTGMNLTDYLTTRKMVVAKELLVKTDNKINFIAHRCGFESMPHFHRVFKKYIGMTPAAYRNMNVSNTLFPQ